MREGITQKEIAKLRVLEDAALRASRHSDNLTFSAIGKPRDDNAWLSMWIADDEAAKLWRKLAATAKRFGEPAWFVNEAIRNAQLHEALAEAARETL